METDPGVKGNTAVSAEFGQQLLLSRNFAEQQFGVVRGGGDERQMLHGCRCNPRTLWLPACTLHPPLGAHVNLLNPLTPHARSLAAASPPSSASLLTPAAPVPRPLPVPIRSTPLTTPLQSGGSKPPKPSGHLPARTPLGFTVSASPFFTLTRRLAAPCPHLSQLPLAALVTPPLTLLCSPSLTLPRSLVAPSPPSWRRGPSSRCRCSSSRASG